MSAPALPQRLMAQKTQRIEVTLETLLDSVDLAEEIVLRVAAETGFDEDNCHKIGMSVREAVINAYSYGNKQERGRKIGMVIERSEERRVGKECRSRWAS